MKQQIKLSDTHYIVMDETQEIKKGDWYLKNDKLITCGNITDNNCKKITHSTQPLDTVAIENDERSYKLYPLYLAKQIAGEVDVKKIVKNEMGIRTWY